MCNFRNAYNAAAVLEWTIAFIFTFYVFSFFIDLLPAVHTKHSARKFGSSSGETEMQMEQNDNMAQTHQTNSRAHDAGYVNGRNTAETDRTLGLNNYRTVNGVKYDMGQLPASSNF